MTYPCSKNAQTAALCLSSIIGLLTPCVLECQATSSTAAVSWQKLNTVAFSGKQDDIFFMNSQVGWYGNGQGLLYRTRDGGQHWDEEWKKPGTFVRALGFLDENVGILGNVGTGYFPKVTDETPLYRTSDGGATWLPVIIRGPMPKGICAIDIFRKPYINHGVLSNHNTLWAGGRVGGPALLLKSTDDGQSWDSVHLEPLTAMVLDVKFVNDTVGFIAGASSADVEKSHAVVLRTEDGGKSWQRVYESNRPWEITWKLSFPSAQTGYVTVQSYDPSDGNKVRYIAKTTDAGLHWVEKPVTEDHQFTEFGVAFLDDNRGWLGGSNSDYETTDGGQSWKAADFGRAVNKIRIVRSAEETHLYAIGSSVYSGTIKRDSSTAGALQTESPTSEIEIGIRQSMEKSLEDWNRGDVAAYAGLYKVSPDTLLVGPTNVRGYEAIIRFFQNNYRTPESRGVLSYSGIEVQPLTERFATVTGRFRLERTPNGGGDVDGYYLLVFEKVGDAWRVVRDDSATIPPRTKH